MIVMVAGVFSIMAVNHARADSVPTDPSSLITEGIQAALASGTSTFGIGLLLSGIRFMGKKINDANTIANDPTQTPLTTFQFHMFLFTGAVGFVAGIIMNTLHVSPDFQSGVAVLLTYFITQLAPAFKHISWTGKKL